MLSRKRIVRYRPKHLQQVPILSCRRISSPVRLAGFGLFTVVWPVYGDTWNYRSRLVVWTDPTESSCIMWMQPTQGVPTRTMYRHDAIASRGALDTSLIVRRRRATIGVTSRFVASEGHTQLCSPLCTTPSGQLCHGLTYLHGRGKPPRNLKYIDGRDMLTFQAVFGFLESRTVSKVVFGVLE